MSPPRNESPGPDAGCPFVCVPGSIPALCARPEGHPGRHAVQWDEDDERRAIAALCSACHGDPAEGRVCQATGLRHLRESKPCAYCSNPCIGTLSVCADHSKPDLRGEGGEPTPEEGGPPSLADASAIVAGALLPTIVSEPARRRVAKLLLLAWGKGEAAERARRAALPGGAEEMREAAARVVETHPRASLAPALSASMATKIRALPIPPPAAPAPGKEPAWLMQERAAKTREWLDRIDAAVAKAVTDRDAEWEARLHAPASNDADAFVASLTEAWGARPSAEAAVRAWQASRAAPAPLAGVLSPGEVEAIEGHEARVRAHATDRQAANQAWVGEYRWLTDVPALLRSHAALLAALAVEREARAGDTSDARFFEAHAIADASEVSRLSAEIDRLHEICRDVMRERDGLKAKVGSAREPDNAYPYHVHAGRMPSHDPWATLCNERRPRSAIASHAAQVDCPVCIAAMERGDTFAVMAQISPT